MIESAAIPDVPDDEIKTSPVSQGDNLNDVAMYDEDYDEVDGGVADEAKDEIDDEDCGGGAGPKPVGTKNRKTTDKRKFGGSSKGRKCYRWTPKQEAAAVDTMLEIRAEGEILGDACFDELYKRLVAKYGSDWNHSISGIHNAWHRRDLVTRVHRAEARAEQQKRLQVEKEDEELGLTAKDKRGWKRKYSSKYATSQIKHGRSPDNENEVVDREKPVITSKRSRIGTSGLTTRSSLSINTTFTPASVSSNLFTPPATMSPSPAVLDFPTVTIGFKRHNNTTRRTREFTDVNTMHKFWNQVVATPMFNNLETDFMVVKVVINNGRNPLHMAQHDKADYSDFLERVERAVDATGEGEVVIDVTAAL